MISKIKVCLALFLGLLALGGPVLVLAVPVAALLAAYYLPRYRN